MSGSRLRTLSVLTVVVLVGGFALAAFVAPLDADQGFRQKIFYLHVPLAIVALIAFIHGGWHAAQYLRKGDALEDLKSYTAIHMGLILGVAALATGMIWAKTSWGVWWEWGEKTLVSFLIIFLLYCTYQPLRFSIEDPERQARYASVFGVAAGVFTPLCFLVVRLSPSTLIHPRTLDNADNLPGGMRWAFLVCIIGVALLYVTLWQFEMTHKHARAQVRALRRKLGGDEAVRARTAAPELPLR